MGRLAWIAVLLGLLLVGCGSEDTSSPLDASLSYLPEGSPFAVAVDTDLEGEQWKGVDSILKRFPGGLDVEDLLGSQLGGEGVDFERDVKPVLGNPFVISAASVGSFLGGGGGDFVAAIQADDQDKLDALVEKTGAKEQGEAGGATLYEDGGTVFAVEDDMVIFAESRELLEKAIERADGDDHLDEEAFEEGLEGLPENALARVYADFEALLGSDPDTRKWRKIEWVGALRTLGLTASVAGDRIDLDFNLRTEGEDLSDEDLPIAAGDESPPILENPGEIGFGIRNPAHIVRFVERAAQAVDPEAFGQYALAKKTLDALLDINIDDDLIGALRGNASGSIGLDGEFGIRAELQDPNAFEQTLEKVSEALPALLEGAGSVTLDKPNAGGDLYKLRQADGDDYVFGVVDDFFVIASGAGRAARLTSAGPERVQGAQGAVVLGADAEQLLNGILRGLGSQLGLGGLGAQLFTDALGDLSGSISVETEGVRGSFRLEIE